SQLAVAVLVEHGAKQAAADAALLAHLLLLLAEDRAERLRTGLLPGRSARLLVLEQLPRQEGQHDRREDLHQLPGLVVAQAAGLAEPGFGARQLPAKHVAEDAGAVGLAGLCPAQHRTQQPAEVAGAGEIVLQRAEQRFGTLRLAGVAAQRTKQQRQRRSDRSRGLCLPGAELLRDLLQRRALELFEQLVGQRTGHGRPPERRAACARAITVAP